jgi:hypothetical protein
MIRRLIPAAALAALAACTANPIAPTSTRVSPDANPGSGARFDAGQTFGSGTFTGPAPGDDGGITAAGDAGPGIGAGVGIVAAPADASTGQLGSGNEDPAAPR